MERVRRACRRLWLCLRTRPTHYRSGALMSEPDLRALEILLVEDSDDDAELTVRALKKCRLANLLHRVRDGEEALEFLFGTGRYIERGSSQPRVVLLDLKLPKLDGRDVLRAIRGDLRTATTPVVVLTSSAEDR